MRLTEMQALLERLTMTIYINNNFCQSILNFRAMAYAITQLKSVDRKIRITTKYSDPESKRERHFIYLA